MKAEYSSPSPSVAEPGAVSHGRSKSSLVWLLPLVIVAGLLVWQGFDTQQQVSAVRQEVTQRLSDAEQQAKREVDALLLTQENAQKFAQRLDALEATLAQSKDNEATLQALYENVAKGREVLDLLEVEQAITLAVQQIQLAANVPVALQALRSADAQLARLDKARHLPLRKALAADIHALHALPLVDLPGISLRLEQIVGHVDKFPLAVYGRPTDDAASAPPADVLDPLEVKPWWQQALADVWHEARSLIRIQRFDREEPALLAPGQGFFLRENLKLRLLTARLALFARDQKTFQSELLLARHWLTQHFLPDDKAVQIAQAQLDELAAARIVIDLPDLRGSQQALLVLRDGKEKQ